MVTCQISSQSDGHPVSLSSPPPCFCWEKRAAKTETESNLCVCFVGISQAVYDRMFTAVVQCINEAIEVQKSTGTGRQTVIGVLDIYGFEIFDNNR